MLFAFKLRLKQQITLLELKRNFVYNARTYGKAVKIFNIDPQLIFITVAKLLRSVTTGEQTLVRAVKKPYISAKKKYRRS